MRCRGELRLEKLIMGDNAQMSRDALFLKIVRFLDMKGDPVQKQYMGSKSLRFLYNMNINEMSMYANCSKNATRHNIHYVKTWRENYCGK